MINLVKNLLRLLVSLLLLLGLFTLVLIGRIYNKGEEKGILPFLQTAGKILYDLVEMGNPDFETVELEGGLLLDNVEENLPDESLPFPTLNEGLSPSPTPEGSPSPAPTQALPAYQGEEGLRSAFLQAMNEYEDFYVEYIAYFQKINGKIVNIEDLNHYTDLLAKMEQINENFKAWEEQGLSAEEVNYMVELSKKIEQELKAIGAK